MTDAGFFKVILSNNNKIRNKTFLFELKGTSADQDSRFSDKNKKLMKSMKFADNIDKKVRNFILK